MRNNKGVSVISLVITIIVLIIVVSITTYQGAMVTDQTRKTMAIERLKAVATAVVAYDSELGYSSKLKEDTFTQISKEDYYIMGLQDFANTSNHAPILIAKRTDTIDPSKKVYELKTSKQVKKNGVYKDDDYVSYLYEFYEEQTTAHYKVEFDDVKGVNRPIFNSYMQPVIVTYVGNDDTLPVLVNDIYQEEWYNYSKESPMWANVMIKGSSNIMYVWIPRFAYKIQNFYLSTDYMDVPSSAIDIVFLKGLTDLMPNDEVLPTGYQVHPAFKYKDQNGNTVNLPGFWVAKRNIDFADNLVSGGGVVAREGVELSRLHPVLLSSNNEVESHLMKNSEWAAIAYLSHYTVGREYTGNSLNNSASGVFELDRECFVAGGIKHVVDTSLPYADKYVIISDEEISYESFEGYSGDQYGSKLSRKFGDAIIATSSGLNDHSAWFGGTSIRVTDENPYILRGIDNNLFAYSATSNNPEFGANFRNVLTVKSK